MFILAKKYHIFLSVILTLSFASQAEAQFWNGLKNALKKKAEDAIINEVKKTGNSREDKTKEKKKSKSARAKKVTKGTPGRNRPTRETIASRPVGRPVVKAFRSKGRNPAKTTKNLYPVGFPPMKFPIPTDNLYEQYVAEGQNPITRFPKCFSILIWAGKTYRLDKNIRRNNFFPRGALWHGHRPGGRSDGKYLMAGFKDENFVPVFGKRFDQWTDQDVRDFKSVAVICRQKYMDELYMEGVNVNSAYYFKMPAEKNLDEFRWQEDLATDIVMSSKAKKVIRRHYPAKEKFYHDAKYFLDTDLIGYSKYVNGTVQTDSDALRNSDSYDTTMAHQRKIYPEYKAALALIDAQKAEAEALPATKENIGKLVAMINDPQFSYLWPDEKTKHKTFLDNRVVALADQIIGVVIADFNILPETMAGLKDLNARYSQTFSDLKNLKSHKWNDLNKAYETRATAIASGVLEGAINEMDSFAGDLDGFNKLVAYREKIRNNLFPFLTRSGTSGQNSSSLRSEFQQAFSARFVEILDQVVSDEINGLTDYTDDMDGLMKMMARNRELRNTLEGYHNGRWMEFERAYVPAFNEKAEDALTDFADKMNSLPATTANLRLIQASLRDIFTERPMPANLQSYRRVVTEQVQRVQKEMKKVACYKKLDKLDLDEDDRDAAILGYNGETTLGMFICGMKKRGYRFQEYDSAGLFSSTSTLSILSNRGITLSIDMEEVEAVKGREMLVGVLVKDITSERELSLTEWQDYAGRLAGR